MKVKYLIIGLIIIVLVIGTIYFIKKKKENSYINSVKNGELTSLYLSYSNGYMMNSNIQYDFKYDEETNKYIVEIKPYLVDEDDKLVIEVDESFKDKLKEIIIKYELVKWDGFNESDKNVLDGDSFSFGAWFKDKTSIHASGYMMWPENYSNVRGELDSLFMNIYNKDKGIDNK